MIVKALMASSPLVVRLLLVVLLVFVVKYLLHVWLRIGGKE